LQDVAGITKSASHALTNEARHARESHEDPGCDSSIQSKIMRETWDQRGYELSKILKLSNHSEAWGTRPKYKEESTEKHCDRT